MSEFNVVTRFSPSPTGFLHVGGLRTALINFLYAKRYNGKFILRIEDTDEKRSESRFTESIYKTLKSFEIKFDEQYVQSSNMKKYSVIAESLVEKGHAYYCTCPTKEVGSKEYKYTGKCRNNRKKPNQPFAIRINTEKINEIVFSDEIRGEVRFGKDNIDDIVIIRSDGIPTYPFACVVDDIEMKISIVIRGYEHLVNTVPQIILYEMLSEPLPKFAHMPLINDENGKKLSKRNGAIWVDDYIKLGILPSALKNYCLLLGSAIKGDSVLIDNGEMIAGLNLPGMSKSSSNFDMKKLLYFNKKHIESLTLEDLFAYIEADLGYMPTPWSRSLIARSSDSIKARSKLTHDLLKYASCYIMHPFSLDDEGRAIIDKAKKFHFHRIAQEFDQIHNWTERYIKEHVESFAKYIGMGLQDVLFTLKITLAGSIDCIPIYEIIYRLEREEVVKRIRWIFR